MPRRRKLLSMGGLMTIAGVVAVLMVYNHRQVHEEAEYVGFYTSGKTINAFLYSFCQAVEQAHADRSGTPLTPFYSADYRVPARGRWVWSGEERHGDVSVRRRHRQGEEDFGPAAAREEWRLYLDGLAVVGRTSCKIDLIEEMELGQSARLTVKFILDGVAKAAGVPGTSDSDELLDLLPQGGDGRPLQDRHYLRWLLVNQAAPAAAGDAQAYNWKIASDELIEATRVEGNGRGFIEPDPKSLGVDFHHRRDPRLDKKKHRSELRFGAMEHASGGLSAADYNNDGRPDLLFLDGRQSRLYRNDGTGPFGFPVFTDATREAGLGDLGQAHVGLFADFDNDGDRDLFVGRYLAGNRYFRNLGDGTFEDASAVVGLDAVVPTTGATLLDYDRDGYLDLYLGVYGNAFEAVPRVLFYSRNGERNRLYRNHGGTRFVDVTEDSATGDAGWTLAVASGDDNGDGWPDLFVANDFGRKNLYRNQGDGTFVEAAKEAGMMDFGAGMGVALGDFDDDGRVDVYTSNMESHQRWFGEDMAVRRYLRSVLGSRWVFADALEYWDLYHLIDGRWSYLFRQIGKGNSLLRNQGDGTFQELRGNRSEHGGWGWSVAFFDADNDTDLDLYAANGWISATPGTDL